jgi:hypothetical protein
VTASLLGGRSRDRTVHLWCATQQGCWCPTLPCKIPVGLSYMVDRAFQGEKKAIGSLFIYSSSINPTMLVDLCDAPGFQPGPLTLMIRSNTLTLVKRRSTWAITSKTSPTTPTDPLWSTLVNLWSNPSKKPLKPCWPFFVTRNFCRVLQVSPKHFKFAQYESCVVFLGTQFLC